MDPDHDGKLSTWDALTWWLNQSGLALPFVVSSQENVERDWDDWFTRESSAFLRDVRGAIDPNEKTGPIGTGEARYLGRNPTIAYPIYFENLDMATAPAQTVKITDHLDPDLFDIASATLGPISFSGRTI